MEREDIQIRSEDVQEILTRVPKWTTRWGTTLIFGLMALIIVLAAVIKYPDTVKGGVVVTAQNPPVEMLLRDGGVVKSIEVQEGNWVNQGASLIHVQNPVDRSSVTLLDSLLKSISVSLYDTLLIEIDQDTLPDFGRMQEDVQGLRYLVNEYNSILTERGQYNSAVIQNLKKQNTFHNRMSTILARRLKIAESELGNISSKLDSYRKLYDKGLVSKVELIQEESLFNETKDEVENLKVEYVDNQLSNQKIKHSLLDLEFNQEEDKRKKHEALQRQIDVLENEIAEWKQVYVLSAPTPGQISYLSTVNVGDFIQPNTPVIAVIPKDQKKQGEIQVNANGLGKVAVGQKVIIELDEYPAVDYGKLTGTVESISRIPIDGEDGPTYNIRVNLPDDLKTSYKKSIKLTGELNGKAKIVTKDRSILQRILNQFEKLFDND